MALSSGFRCMASILFSSAALATVAADKVVEPREPARPRGGQHQQGEHFDELWVGGSGVRRAGPLRGDYRAEKDRGRHRRRAGEQPEYETNADQQIKIRQYPVDLFGPKTCRPGAGQL